jgi:hypothetical protein
MTQLFCNFSLSFYSRYHLVLFNFFFLYCSFKKYSKTEELRLFLSFVNSEENYDRSGAENDDRTELRD